MKKLGIRVFILVALVVSSIRFYLYSILTKTILALLIASLDGILYAASYALITTYCDSVAEPGSKATVQAAFNCLFDGVGEEPDIL